MILVVCLDDAQGMMFNKRRQSRDRVLISDLLDGLKGERLFVSPYSAELFPENDARITVCEDPALKAGENDLCFCEDFDPRDHADRMDGIIIYRWNRVYPADRKFRLDMSAFKSVQKYSFVGSSHANITKEIFKK